MNPRVVWLKVSLSEIPASLLVSIGRGPKVVRRIVLRDPFESLLAGSFAEHVPTYDKSGTKRQIRYYHGTSRLSFSEAH